MFQQVNILPLFVKKRMRLPWPDLSRAIELDLSSRLMRVCNVNASARFSECSVPIVVVVIPINIFSSQPINRAGALLKSA